MENHIKKCPHRSTEADKLQLIIDTGWLQLIRDVKGSMDHGPYDS